MEQQHDTGSRPAMMRRLALHNVRLAPLVGAAAVVAAAAMLVGLTLRQPDVPAYAPTRRAPADAGQALVGPVLFTVDAAGSDRWRYFSFRLGTVVEEAGREDWDLGFRRHQIIANGGPGFLGKGGILDLGEVPFDDVREVPRTGYQGNEGDDPRNRAIADWYRYGFFSHVLTPRPHVWAVRTADGRYAKIEIVSYYCPGARSGCLTFRYVYQVDGSTAVSRQAAAGDGPTPGARGGGESGNAAVFRA